MTINNVIEILGVAEHLSMQELFSKAFAFILYHFEKITKTQSFASLDANILKNIVKSTHLKVSSETLVHEAIIEWINVDKDSRTKHLSELVKNLRTSELSKQQIQDFHLINTVVNQEQGITDFNFSLN